MTRLRSVALTVGASVGSLCLLAAVAALVLDVTPLIFRSGSMGPEIPAGSVALARTVDAGDLEAGDVVSVLTADGVRVTHRIVAIDDGAGRDRLLTLQGDANSSPDAESYAVSEVDRVFVSVPGAGHAIAWLERPVGLLVLGGLGGALLVYAFRPIHADRAGRHRSSMLIAAPIAATVLIVSATQTGAWFSDSGTVSSGPVAAHTMELQEDPECENVGGLLGGLAGSADVSWSHVDRRYVYDWAVIRQSTGATLESDTLIPPETTPAGTELTQRFSTSLLNIGLGEFDLRVEIRPRLRDGTWTTVGSPAVTITPIQTASLIVGLSVRCGNG